MHAGVAPSSAPTRKQQPASAWFGRCRHDWPGEAAALISLGGEPDRVPGTRYPVSPAMTITASPSATDFRAIYQALDAFNAPVIGHADFVPLAVLLHDVAEQVIGGLWGWTVYSWLCINMVFVPKTMRHHGLGSGLIRAAESEARSRGCVGMQVDTFGFQAQPFYEGLGFTVFGVQPNFPPGQTCVFLRKPFDDG